MGFSKIKNINNIKQKERFKMLTLKQNKFVARLNRQNSGCKWQHFGFAGAANKSGPTSR